jgi:sn-glycerol 3-phosphate transport system substrate-binding protein
MPPNQHDTASADFTAGKVGMLFRSSASLASITSGAKFEVGVTLMPCKKSCSEPLGGASMVIFKTTAEKQKAAWEFVQWMTNGENTVDLFIKTGYIPLRKSVGDVPALKDFIAKSPNAKAIVDTLQYASAIPVFGELGNSDDQLRQAIQKVELGTAAPKDALDAAAATINKAMAGQ